MLLFFFLSSHQLLYRSYHLQTVLLKHFALFDMTISKTCKKHTFGNKKKKGERQPSHWAPKSHSDKCHTVRWKEMCLIYAFI